MARLLALSDVSKPSHSHATVPSPPKITQEVIAVSAQPYVSSSSV